MELHGDPMRLPADWQQQTQAAMKQRSESGDAAALRLLALEGADLSAESHRNTADGPDPRPTAGRCGRPRTRCSRRLIPQMITLAASRRSTGPRQGHARRAWRKLASRRAGGARAGTDHRLARAGVRWREDLDHNRAALESEAQPQVAELEAQLTTQRLETSFVSWCRGSGQ